MKTRLSAGCIALMKCPSGKPNPEILIPIITLIPQFVVLHPVLDLLVGHVEVVLLLDIMFYKSPKLGELGV